MPDAGDLRPSEREDTDWDIWTGDAWVPIVNRDYEAATEALVALVRELGYFVYHETRETEAWQALPQWVKDSIDES
jgi:hypothetical protein